MLLLAAPTPTPFPVQIVDQGHWYDGFAGQLFTAVLAAVLSLAVALVVFYRQRAEDRRDRTRLSAQSAAEELTAAAFLVSNALTQANRDPGTAWQRTQAQRPFDEVVLRKSPAIFDESVVLEIHQTGQVLGAFLRWMNEEDEAFGSGLDHISGQPNAPESLDQNFKQAEALTVVMRQFERLSLVLNNFRRSEAAPTLSLLPEWPEHTPRWD